MARYFIFEGNMEKLKAKIAVIERKCAKYGLKFYFEEVGEEIRETVIKGETIQTRFVEVEVEGIMKHQDWEFVAQIDHYKEGNIIRQFKTDIEVPDRFRHTAPVCEHCNTLRGRKFTYLVHNTATGEWKQVGSSCLKEFTFGIDAEDVAKYISLFDELIVAGEAPYRGVSCERYYDIKTFICYAKETVDKLGYVSTADADYGTRSTKDQTFDFYLAIEMQHPFLEKTREKAEELEFNAKRESNQEYAEAALTWIRSLTEEETDGNSYLFNLKVACSQEWMVARNGGFVVSLIPTYRRHLEKLAYEAKQRKAREESPSRHQGTIGQRLTIKVKEITCVCSNDYGYGLTFLYKILDEAGNVFMWSTGKCLDSDTEYTTVTGTVKSHDEYRGVAQTFLTRCKVA